MSTSWPHLPMDFIPVGITLIPARSIPAQVSYGTTASFQASLTVAGISSLGFRWISELLLTSMDCRDAAASPWFSPRGAGESWLWCLEHLLHLCLHCPWYSHSFSFHISSIQNYMCTLTFFPFSNMLTQRCYYHSWLAWTWPAVCPF